MCNALDGERKVVHGVAKQVNCTGKMLLVGNKVESVLCVDKEAVWRSVQ